ncbi:MAG: dephospho-CoA kinase [Anaerolineales bacterium]|nr:dephospho-CoA kinase [Anaerolineales bacterium]
MSRWTGKYVIGLTGNIATGKSVVRKMLEHLGAFGIDADEVAHRAMSRGGPAYEAVIRLFGEWILDSGGEINRKALGRLAFADAKLLDELEDIMHPLVLQAVDLLITRSHSPVIVLEAIKLFESGLAESCDTVWVVDASPDIQIDRLIRKRGLSESIARQRIAVQPPQKEKLARAKVVIKNSNSFEDTWNQVQAAWAAGAQPAEALPPAPVVRGELAIRRGRPSDADLIADFLNKIRKPEQPLTRADIMAAFGQKAYFLLEQDEQMVGAIGWQVDNLVTRADEIVLAKDAPVDQALQMLITAMETASAELQSEAAVIYSDPALAKAGAWKSAGYAPAKAGELGVKAWEEAAQESEVPGAALLFKRLREDRILRPI